MKAVRSLLCGILAFSGCCYANALVDMGPESNFQAAELVVVGKATDVDLSYNQDHPDWKGMSVQVEVVLKGIAPSRKIMVLFFREAEFRCNFGVVGERYLLMLLEHPVYQGVYAPVDGCYGVFRMKNTRVGYD